jgi:hypothetical protein
MSDISMGNKNSGNVSNSRIGKRALSIGLAAILVLSSIVVALPVKNVYAAVSIRTSVDDFGRQFYGPALVRVVIEDSNARGSGNVSVNISVDGKASPQPFNAKETGTNTGVFELFIAANTDARPQSPTVKPPTNTTSIVRIYNGASDDADGDPTTDDKGFRVDLQKNDKIRISYSTLPDVVLTYAPTPATLTVDRTLVGDQNLIRLKLKDPDANLDPTGVDKFTVDQTNNIIEPGLDIAPSPNDAEWRETGTNTGVFELIVKVNSNDPTTSKDNQVGLPGITFPSSVLFRVKDNEVYHKPTDKYPNNTDTLDDNARGPFDSVTLPIPTPSTVSTTVQLRNSNGNIDLAAPLTIANGFQIKVTDADRNMDTTAKDAIESTTLNTTSPTSAPGSDTNALDGNVNYNITNGTTGLKVTTTGPASGTITLTSTLTFTFTGGASPAITGVTATIPASDITITAPSGFNVTSKSGTATVTSGTTIQTIVNIGFSTTSAGTFTIADNTNPITVTVSGITVSGSPTTATLTSVSTTAVISPQTPQIAINGVVIPVVFKETDDNTGVFLPDLAGNKIQIVPTTSLPSGTPIVSGKIVLGSDNKIHVLASAISEDIDLTISYIDPQADPSGPKEFKIIRKIQHFAGNISTTTTSVPVTGKAVIEINDMDLNLNPDAIDIYTLTINTNNSPVASFNGLAELKVKVNGKDTVAFASGTTIQFVETGANTGIFRGEFSVNRITDTDTTVSGTQALVDGDKITFEYKDLTESPALTRSVDVKIGKPSGTVELDRSSYPPTTSLGTTKLHITITDPSFNSSSTSQDVLTLKDADNIFENGELRIQLIKGNTTITIQPGFLDANGNPLTITPSGLSFPTSANETGVNTGVFTVDIDLPRQVGTTTIDDGWQIRVIYKDSNGDDQTATATVTTNTAQVTTDKPTYDLGQTIILRVIEPDWNFDSDKVDEISLSTLGSDFVVNSDKVSDRQLATLGAISGISLDPSSTIRETGKNTGIFEIQIKSINSNLVSRGKNLEFTYTDRTPSGGGTEIEVKHTVLITSATVDIIFDKETYTPFDRVLVSIVDPAANQDPDTKDKLTGDARVRVIVGGTSQTLTPEFEETEANSGVFRYKPNDKGILITGINPNAKPGDGIRVEYRSPDKQTEISKSVPIVFNNGSISLDKDSYKPNETVVITINDPDENRNPDIPDQFEVKVVSTTDPTGIKVTVRETGDRTGVFKAEVILTTGLSSGNRLQVREGDQITAIYTDETLPNAQTINQQLVNRNQVGLRTLQTLDVQASAVVGVLLAPTERTTVAKPSLRDQAGNVLTQASVDVPVSIASSIKNNTQQPQKFVYIVQVKDADGFVVSISTVGGTLPAGQSFDVSASWTPTAAGTYTVEVFVWTELGKPSPLSKVETATVTVV